jgi:UPF0755 protein
MLNDFRETIHTFVTSNTKREIILSLVFLLVWLFGVLNISLWMFPGSFPQKTTFEIKKGATLSEVASVLQENHYVHSNFWFKALVTALGGSKGVVAGDYYFAKPEGVLQIASRVVRGEYGLVPLRVTIPEGLSNAQTAEILSEQFSLFDPKIFVKIAKEGEMFPDTYFFLPNVSATSIMERMKGNFDEKIATLESDIASSTRTLPDILTMASIIENEAQLPEDRKIVSGILWKRIDIGMALQVDATFKYINGKTTFDLTLDDLGIDSPYNTYNRRGLPPTPISNPGLQSIKDAIYPEETNYLYFLSDAKGKMYYAEDFEGHQRNRELYLGR